MSEPMNEISKLNIRTELNLIFALMKGLANILDMAIDLPVACSALKSGAQALFVQSGDLLTDVTRYADALNKGSALVNVEHECRKENGNEELLHD